MNLKNQDPRNFIGRTVIFRHEAWRVDGVDDTHVLLSKPGLEQTGKLMHIQGWLLIHQRTWMTRFISSKCSSGA